MKERTPLLLPPLSHPPITSEEEDPTPIKKCGAPVRGEASHPPGRVGGPPSIERLSL